MARSHVPRSIVIGLVLAAAAFFTLGGAAHPATPLNAIQIENAKPGTPGWDDFSSVGQQDAISGFASKISVNHGDSVDLYVTTTAASFTIDIFRMGWYGGAGARLVESLGSFPGVHQAIPPPDPVTGMVSCDGWTKTTTLNIPSDWVTGVYLAKLSASSGNKSFILFVVRDDGGHEAIDFQDSVTTYQAYNAWGGVSLYTNNTNKAIYKYAAATKVSFDRPFDPLDGNGAGQFFAFEYPYIRWAEKQGYDLTYTTDVDTDTNVNPLTNHRMFMSVGHDEYWSKGMRDNVTNAIAAGVNVAFFSANSAYWQIRFEPNAQGVPDRVEVGYKGFATSNAAPGPDPQWGVNNAIVTTRWRDDPVNLPENSFIGVMYQDQVQKDYAYVVQDSSNWIYAGTGFTDGTSLPGIVGYEYDKVWNNGFSPPGLTILSNSPVVGCCEGSGNSFSNATIYTAPSGAEVFADGTMQWSWGLDNYSSDGNFVNAGLQRATQNIFDRFTQGSGTPAPAVSLTPTSLGFGSQTVGTTSASQSITLTNSGTAPLTLSSIGLTGVNTGDFSEANTCPLAPAQIAAGGACSITVSFTPTAAGPRSAAVQITDDASDSPQTVQLAGTGAAPAPAVSLTPPSLSFGSIVVGQTSGMQSIVLKNTGTAPLQISAIGLTGANAGDFTEASDCPATVAVGATCAINLTFQPTATGPRAASVQVTDNAADSPQAAGVSGTGTSNTPSATLSPSSLTFASQTVGSTSASQSVTVQNTGGAPLAISSIAVAGTNAADFAETSTCPLSPATVAPNASCSISVTFTPSAVGTRSASVQLTDNAADSPQALSLSGTGAAPANVAFDKNLGQKTENVGGTSMTLTTSAAASAHTRVTVFAVWNSASATLSSVSGGGLTWTVDNQTKDGNNDHVAIASADAPSGLASGVVLTTTFSASVTHGLIAAASFTGVVSAGAVDAVGSSTQAGVAAWSAAVKTVTANDLVVGFSVVDANATSTPTAPNVEIHDFGDSNYWGWATSVYQIVPTAGNATVNGTWSRTGGTANGTVAVAYKAAAAAAPAPAVSLTPASLAYGSVLVGSSSTSQSSVLKNTGTAALAIQSIGAAGTNAGDFQVTTDCPASLAAGATCNLTAVFAPSAPGPRSASIRVVDNAADSPQNVSLSGTGTAPAPAVTLSPTSLTFSPAAVGSASAPLGISVQNSGTATLNISAIGIGGTNAGDFSQTNTCPAALAVGASCSVSVTFSPLAGGARTATLQITDDANGSPQSAPLSGTGLAPAVTLVPTSLTFASRTIGTTSPAQTTTLTNSGNAALAISGISVIGESAGDYGITTTCPASLAAGANCAISVTFTPGGPGARNAAVRIADNAGDSPQVVSLSGTGASPQPAVTLSPSSVTFTGTLVGSTSPAQTVSLTNSGDATLNLASIGIAGSNPGDFGQTNTCPASLAPAASCSISVTFSPSVSGPRSASLQVSDDATGSPQSVGLSGSGVTPAPAVTFTPTSLAFGAQRVGTTSVSQTLTVTNSGNATLTVSNISLTGANSGDFSIVSNGCPASLAAGASCNVGVTFTPTATGPRAAAVSVTDNAADSPESAGLSGAGTAPAATWSPSAGLSFGSQLVGSTSAGQTETLTNTGTAPLAVSSISITGTNAGDFAQTNTCPASLAAGASCTVTVTFTPSAAGPRAATLQVADDAAGSPQSVPLSGTGSTSSIAFDKNLGQKTQNVGGTTMTLTTAAAASAGGRVFLFVEWNNSTRVLSSVSGGGLTWTIAVQAKEANNNHLAVASAAAPTGLASGVVLTATFSGSVTHGLIAAASFTGVSPTTDGTTSTTAAGTKPWSATLTTTNPTDLVLGFSTIDANTTDTPTAPNTEIHDFGDANYYGWATTVYQITSGTPGQKTVNGTWAANTGATGNLTVAAAFAGG